MQKSMSLKYEPTSEPSAESSGRARIQGSYTFVSLNSRLESNKEEEKKELGGRHLAHERLVLIRERRQLREREVPVQGKVL